MKKQSNLVRASLARIGAALLISALLSMVAAAQTVNSTVSGTVKDQAGAVVPGARVVLSDAATKLDISSTTNQEGFYIFNDVRAGMYSVTAEAGGFKKTQVREVKVDVSIPASIHITLEAGQIAEVITTSASEAQAVINTVNAELTTTVMERQINDLPLNGRSPIQLARLQAGVATIGSTRNATINGMRGSFNNITWDGINIQENYLRGDASSGLFAQAGPSVAGVSEFSITTQNASAADGAGVAQIKLVTPRGSTAYHGNLFEFHRNDALDANDFFNNANGLEKEKLIRNQFGFGVGGPIKLPTNIFGPLGFDTHKLFFYAYMEETRSPRAAALTRIVLSDAARLGNFTYRRSDNNELQTVNLLSLTGRSVDTRIKNLIGLTPSPNDFNSVGDRINSAGFRFNSPAGSTERLWGFRIDYNLSDKHRFEAIYSRDSVFTANDAATNNTGEPFPGLPGKGQSPKRHRGSFAWNSSLTPVLTNELRSGFYRQASFFFTNVTFPEGNLLTFPSVGGTLTNPVQNSQQSGRNGRVFELSDNAAWVHGSHVLRFGGNFRRTHLEPFSRAGILPTYTIGFGSGNINPLSSTNRTQFPGGLATNDFTSASNLLAFLSGAVTTGTRTFNVSSATSGYVNDAEQRRNLEFDAIGGFAQDTWRVKPNLTVNLGLRYDYYTPTKETNGIGLMPVGGLEGLGNPNLVYDLAGGGNGTRPFYNPDRNNFAPNISFAWDPFKTGKTSIRAGYSISYVIDSLIQMAENSAIDGNDGLTSTVQVPNLIGTVSGGGLVPIAVPIFKVPRTIKDQQLITQAPTAFTIDPNLKTPYVQQWNLSIEREILPDTVLEARYVGNHGVKLLRAIDINQVVIFNNGFLDDFRRAQKNLQLSTGVTGIVASPAYNPAISGSQPLTVFPKVGRGGFYTTPQQTALNATLVNLISQGQIGELVQTYSLSRSIYLTPGTNGATVGPGFFLRANPEAGNVDYMGNGSFSNYHALQAEVRRRLRNGLYLQANYSWSKGYTDFDGSSANFAALLDVDNAAPLEKKRNTNDITHIFKANGLYELPFGPGKPFLNQGGVIGKILGGWQAGGIFEIRTGRPISFVSARGTVNRTGRSPKNAADSTLSAQELQELTGLFYDPVSGRPLYVSPSLIGVDGRANPAILTNPLAGTYGKLQLTPVSGPGFWNVDLSAIKRTRITETLNIEFRLEAFNTFNHTNFFVTNEQNDINSTTFGRLATAFDPRILQIAMKINF
ncbi:MAG: TonB-dependent receptor [Acidobacteriota bacterium]